MSSKRPFPGTIRRRRCFKRHSGGWTRTAKGFATRRCTATNSTACGSIPFHRWPARLVLDADAAPARTRNKIPKPRSQNPNPNVTRTLGFFLIWDLGFGIWDFLERHPKAKLHSPREASISSPPIQRTRLNQRVGVVVLVVEHVERVGEPL